MVREKWRDPKGYTIFYLSNDADNDKFITKLWKYNMATYFKGTSPIGYQFRLPYRVFEKMKLSHLEMQNIASID